MFSCLEGLGKGGESACQFSMCSGGMTDGLICGKKVPERTV